MQERRLYLLVPPGLSVSTEATKAREEFTTLGDDPESSMPRVVDSVCRICFWDSSSDIEINWYNLSRDAIAVH
jgi:hypothetical protein